MGGLEGSGSGRCFSATLKRGDQRQETVPACQPQLGYGGAFGMVVANQVDKLIMRPSLLKSYP